MFFNYDKLPSYFTGNLVFNRERKSQQERTGIKYLAAVGNGCLAQGKLCRLVIYTAQLPLRETRGHTTASGDANTPTDAAQVHQAGTGKRAHTAPQAGTSPSSFLQHGSRRGKSSAPAPSAHPPGPRTRPPVA